MYSSFFSELNQMVKEQQSVLLTGLSDSARSMVWSELYRDFNGKVLCLVADEEMAYDLEREMAGFIDKEKIFIFPGRNFLFIRESISQGEVKRIMTLDDCLLHPGRRSFIIATAVAFLHPLVAVEEMKENLIYLDIGKEIDFTQMAYKLIRGGYSRTDTVTRPGEYAIRGDIIDIFSLNVTHPYRIELFGDTIESIRRFDISTQRSGKAEAAIIIFPADELCGEQLTATLLDYLGSENLILFDEPRSFYQTFEKGIKRYKTTVKEAQNAEKKPIELPLVNREKIADAISSQTVLFHAFFPGNIPQVQVAKMQHISQKEMEPFFNNYSVLFTRIKEWQSKKLTVQLAIRNQIARENMNRELIDHHLSDIEFVDFQVERGFVSSTMQIALISEKDIWGKRNNPKRQPNRKKEEHLLAEDLKIGDYIVHEAYGIGIYRGVTQVETDGITREYILLQYAGTDKLYLPPEKLDLLFKYKTAEEKEPRLSKLGGSEWERTKRKVSQSIKDMTEELLKLYAARQAREGFSFSPDTPWQLQFEDAFPYEETRDQLKAIQEVKRDMESRRPMDRLICGDVGYGKTEVALRAAFKAIMDSKQVAVLVPTTVLAEQHFRTFSQRFASYPAAIEVLSRFRSSAQQKRIVDELKKGAIDIVIGTHRLLSKDIAFKDLGLLVIDEEHRFGVAQKEKIKALKEQVDVLSLSATPIPRSLNMSLTGMRDLTLIETPPPGRYPIITYVMEYDEEIIKEAINNEVERQGQVFYVHNRIEDIYQVYARLKKMLPDIAIGIGHGRMKEEELSQVMMEFMAGQFAVFLCTTIIESGLDMPNVNTIIVDEAGKMGLAQLYQLRGRVGRSSRVAYAYLTYLPDKIMNETAQKRLNAIREFNELGSGMKIALRDLQIRGAGNILGPEQHGYIHAVGFDLYCRLLEQETARMKGTVDTATINTQLDIDVDYYIPESYIPDSGSKMRIYRSLLLAGNQEEFDEIKEEVIDRFGKMPAPVENFFQVASLRLMAQNKQIKTLKRQGKNIEIQLTEELPADFGRHLNNVKFKRINKYTLSIRQDENSLQALQDLLTIL